MIYGIFVLGMVVDGWLVFSCFGLDWLSGGVFGVEVLVVVLILCILCMVVLVVVVFWCGLIVVLFWCWCG